MSYSSAFRWLWPLVPLLVLSVAWKIAIPIDEHAAKASLIDFFERKRFAVTEQTVDGISVINAKARSCQIQAARLVSDASNRDEVRYLFKGLDRYFIVFDGRVYMQEPVLSTLIDEVWSVSLRRLGLISHVPGVIAVAASESCNAEQLPWNELK